MGFKVTAYAAADRGVAEEYAYDDEDEFEVLDNGVLVVTRPAKGEVRYFSPDSWYEVVANAMVSRRPRKRTR